MQKGKSIVIEAPQTQMLRVVIEGVGPGFLSQAKGLKLVGNAYFFRTVTYHMVGKVVAEHPNNIIELEDASWVADSGRFMNAIKSGTLNEVEPVGKAYINIKSVTDFFPWTHSLPKEQK